jgi:Zn-dependent protease with chaperone function
MELSPETFEAYYQLQMRFNIGWICIQMVFILSLLFMGLTRIGQAAYVSISGRIKVWPLAVIAFYFLTAFALKVIQSAIVHPLISQKAQLDGASAPAFLALVGAQVPANIGSALVLALSGLGLVLILSQKSRLTWLWLAVIVTGIASGYLAVRPSLLHTTPLGDSPVEQRMVQMLERAGISPDRVALVDCSELSDCPPGQVIGLGPTKLMLFDGRLASKTPEDQLLQVAAHEAKHFLLDNDFKPVIAIFLICSFVLLAGQGFIQWVSHGPRNRNESVSLVLGACAVGLIAYLLAQPIVTTFQRNLEHEADIFGLELNRDNQALSDIMWADAEANPMLYRHTPITRYFRATHPQIRDRLDTAATYKPWLTGEPLRYGQWISE